MALSVHHSNTSLETCAEKPIKYVLPEPAPFKLSNIKNAIPQHCFEHSYIKSFGYLFFNIFCVFLIWRVTWFFDHPAIPPSLLYILWPLYWWIQGCVVTGLWVIGHECGHGGFSANTHVNNAVGLIVHSSLLVPFFSWKYTHAAHHMNCAAMERDEVFVPNTKSEIDVDHPLKFTAFTRVFHVLVFLFLGWPLHLIIHVTGQKYPGWTNHFNPLSGCFTNSQRIGVVVSDLALGVVGYGLYTLCLQYGFMYMCMAYFFPYLVVNMWLVIITQLQHTNVAVPHYRGKEWNWLRGALATVDRDYGAILNSTFHHIQDTHVVHHLFSKMPFYHAQEATKAIAPVLGRYRLFDDTPIWSAVWNCYRDCIYVPDEGGIIFYQSPKNR